MVSDEVKKEIDRCIAKYPEGQQQSAVISALRLVQDENQGYLTEALMNFVADYLKMDPIAVYEVATFYSHFNLQPIGRHKLMVCSNISCKLMGSDHIVSHLEKRLGIKAGETTPDGQYTLIEEVECLGACVGGPMMQVDCKDYHEQLTPEKVDALLDGLESKKASSKGEENG